VAAVDGPGNELPASGISFLLEMIEKIQLVIAWELNKLIH
jgi:hypothetical protein